MGKIDATGWGKFKHLGRPFGSLMPNGGSFITGIGLLNHQSGLKQWCTHAVHTSRSCHPPRLCLWSELLPKISPKNSPFSWATFCQKNAPTGKKIRPNGEILPNLVTLQLKVSWLAIQRNVSQWVLGVNNDVTHHLSWVLKMKASFLGPLVCLATSSL